MDKLSRAFVFSRFPSIRSKIRLQVACISAGLKTYTKKQKSGIEQAKEGITSGPSEILLKASAKEHPALTGQLTKKHHVEDFEALGLRSDLCNALKTFGIDQPTNIQTFAWFGGCLSSSITQYLSLTKVHAIPKILEGQNVLCTSQTGSGKTLAYLLPIIHLLKNQEDIDGIIPRQSRPQACIVVPFRELAVQVLGVVKSLSHFTKLRSLGLISGRKKKWIREGLSNSIDIVVGTPQTLLKYQEKGDIYLSDLSHIVIDEADTMFDGSFITMAVDILKYSGVISTSWKDNVPLIQTTFVTTTVPQEILKIIDSIVPNMHICSTGLHQVLPHVSQKFVKVPQHKKSHLLVDILSRELQKSSKQIMVFCNTTKSCDWTSYFLEEQGISHVRLNGNMPKKERRLHLKRFQEMEAPVLVCTDIASRGLDTTNVSHVINFDFPVSVMDYMHRAGRTGRLGYSFTSEAPQLTSFLSHNKELVIMEQIKKAMQANIPLDDGILWQNIRQKRHQRI